MQGIELLKAARKMIIGAVEGLSEEQLVTIPKGFNNNILWNLTHLAVTQQLLHYKLAKVGMNVPEELVEQNKKGTSPKDWTTQPDVKFVKEKLIELPELFAQDYAQNKFSQYNSYKTSTGFELTGIDDAILFNNFHEGLHLGSILALKKLV